MKVILDNDNNLWLNEHMKTKHKKVWSAHGNLMPEIRAHPNMGTRKLYVLDMDDLPEVKGGRYAIVGVSESTRMAVLDDMGYTSKKEAVRAIRIGEVVRKAQAEGTVSK